MSIHFNIIELAKQNENFRQVIKTGKHSQVVLMKLLPGEDIGNEVHDNVDQILVFVHGNGHAKIDEEEFDFKAGDMAFVDAGIWHNFTNTGDQPLKLYTVYSPANHPYDRVQKNKPLNDED